MGHSVRVQSQPVLRPEGNETGFLRSIRFIRLLENDISFQLLSIFFGLDGSSKKNYFVHFFCIHLYFFNQTKQNHREVNDS